MRLDFEMSHDELEWIYKTVHRLILHGYSVEKIERDADTKNIEIKLNTIIFSEEEE